MKADLWWIPGPWRGRMAIAARPRGGDWLDAEAEAWRQADIDVVVSLLEDQEAAQLELRDERQAAERHGIRLVHFPIADRGVPESTHDAVSLIAELGTELETGRNVAVHCRQGIGRSGLIAAGLLMTSGASPQEAWQTISAARGVPVPETPQQRRWAERLHSELSPAKR